jgi:hypothetical protein
VLSLNPASADIAVDLQEEGWDRGDHCIHVQTAEKMLS